MRVCESVEKPLVGKCQSMCAEKHLARDNGRQCIFADNALVFSDCAGARDYQKDEIREKKF